MRNFSKELWKSVHNDMNLLNQRTEGRDQRWSEAIALGNCHLTGAASCSGGRFVGLNLMSSVGKSVCVAHWDEHGAESWKYENAERKGDKLASGLLELQFFFNWFLLFMRQAGVLLYKYSTGIVSTKERKKGKYKSILPATDYVASEKGCSWLKWDTKGIWMGRW